MPKHPSARPPIDLRIVGGEIWLGLRLQPKASRNQLRVEPDGRVKASVTAPPADGAANAALCEFLADVFGLPKSAIRVARGQKSRDKTIAIRGTTAQYLAEKLSPGACF